MYLKAESYEFAREKISRVFDEMRNEALSVLDDLVMDNNNNNNNNNNK